MQRATTFSTDCSCSDPLGRDTCYQPVCPPGYYKCCSTCKEASCYGTKQMYLSWRGLPECLECETGDYCPGCDTFFGCPDSTQPNRAGPRISGLRSSGINQCESCPRGLEASFDRGACMPKYSHACNVAVVSRCIRNCRAADPVRGKELTPCENMKCTMYCAKKWSEECRDKVEEYCIFATTPPINMSGGVEAEEGAGAIANCNVNCNLAVGRVFVSAPLAVGLVAVIAASSLL